ncbi:MAG: FtsQ-type POTRA domain-containing protein [Opitutaceae bacterium]|nr:FtsQ-type POTRA domain-containing protein [Opitutaceae bacterium]
MNRNATPFPSARSWRDIPQEIAPRSMSREGRRRLTMGLVKACVVTVLVAVGAWAAFELVEIWQHDPAKLAAPVKSEPLRAIRLNTDGVLDLKWIEGRLKLQKGVTLMELDLVALQGVLLSDGQVKTAVLTRRFPDTLIASLQERSPVARLRAVDASGNPADLLVARDGVVFPGSNFSDTLISSLPWLGGVTLHRSGAGFVPISGMETVADLLVTAQGNVPVLYRSWRVISLERLASDGEIVVKTTDPMDVVFGTRDDFFKQVALLDAVLAEIRLHPQNPVATINLTYGKQQVPVSFSGVPALGAQSPVVAAEARIHLRPDRPDAGIREAAATRTTRHRLFQFQSLQPRN